MPPTASSVIAPVRWETMLNKVPEVTVYFWLIKVMCTTVGETAADFLNVNLNLGLTGVSILTGVLLASALFFQLRAKKYIPTIYWATVALVSVFGTLITDNLTDRLGVPLEVSTIVFGVLLALTFSIWYFTEKTLSIHSIFTRRREVFYWLTILFTFALGTASGDLMAEGLGLGYLTTGLIVAGVIILTVLAWRLRLNSILSFWIIYIMTRPLGASIGDYLSQTPAHGGLGLGVTGTSALFVGGIVVLVLYLSFTRRDAVAEAVSSHADGLAEKGGLWQTVVVLILFLVAGGVGYSARHAALQAEIVVSPDTSSSVTATQPIPASPLGDLFVFRTITQDTFDKLTAGDQFGATTRIGDLEYEWDNAQSRLKSRERTRWTLIDGKIDIVLRELRAVNPKVDTEKAALEDLLAVLK